MRIKGIFLPLFILCMVSCSPTSSSSSHRGGNLTSSTAFNSNTDSVSKSTVKTTETKSSSYSGSITSDSTTQSNTTASLSSTSVSLPDLDLTAIPVEITAINDFHGQLDENADNGYVGISKMASYLIDRKEKGDILISSGDMYQGSYLCNIDKGAFVSKTFKDIGFDAYTIGNHEFDWGVSSILDNEAALGQRFLGANIYNYPKIGDSWVKSDFGQEYKIVTLYENTPYEIRVGIIGVIGTKQITSITSLFVEDYIFLDPTEIVKTTSTKLRNELNCDLVIASYHADDPSNEITEIDSTNGHPYVDACFMAHTHEFQNYKYNDVPLVQGGAYSRGVSRVSFTFNKNSGKATLITAGYEYLADMNLQDNQQIKKNLENLKEVHSAEFTNIIGTNSTGWLINTGEMAKFYAKITYDRAVNEYSSYNIRGCIFNYARRSLKEGDFTYSDLFETHPFLNDIYIFSVSERDINNEASYNYGYFDSSYNIHNSDSSVFHDVLVYNYIGFHIGVNYEFEKYYNYFPSAFTSSAEHPPVKISFNCFEEALNWLEIHHEITSSDYSGSGFFG